MPGGIFDVVGVGRLVDLELLPAILVAFGIIEGETALPKLGFRLRDGLDDFVEGFGGVVDAGLKEGIHSLFHPLIQGFGGFLSSEMEAEE